MRKLLFGLMGIFVVMGGARADGALARDTSDPLYMLGVEETLSQTTLTFWDNVLRAGQSVSYGMNDRLTIGANVHYQIDFDGDEDGFSAIDVGGAYRMSNGSDNSAQLISDVLFGLKCVRRILRIPRIMLGCVLGVNGRV